MMENIVDNIFRKMLRNGVLRFLFWRVYYSVLMTMIVEISEEWYGIRNVENSLYGWKYKDC